MATHSRSPLPPLWMERQDLVNSFRREFGLPQFPTAETIIREAEQVRREMLTGIRPWDPKSLIAMVPPAGRFGSVEEFDVPCLPDTQFGIAALPSVHRFMSSIEALAAVVPGMGDPSQYSSLMLSQLFSLRNWERYGKRVFVLDADTYELLARTDLGNLRVEHLNAPLPSFYIKLPEGSFSFPVEGDPIPQPVEGVLATFSEAEGSPDRVRTLTLLVCGRSPRAPEDDNIVHCSVLLAPDAKLSEIRIKGLISNSGQDLDLMIPRAILGLCLYLESEHPVVEPIPPAPKRDLSQIKNPAKRRKAEKQNSRFSSLPYLYVGRPFTDAERQYVEETGGRGVRGPLDHPVWVRAHWRMQPYGPSRSLRKKIRIPEYRRGPDQAESLRMQAVKLQRARERQSTPS